MSNQLDATIAKRFDIIVKENQTFDSSFLFIATPDNIEFTDAEIVLSVRQDGCGCNTGCECADGAFNTVFKQDFVPTVGGADQNQLTFNDIVRLAHGNYKYDLLVKFPDGTQQYLMAGTFKVKKSYSNIV